LSTGHIPDVLSQLNGFYAAVVTNSENIVYAIVDRVRSIPLYYAFDDSKFYISDDSRWIMSKVSSSFDDLSITEFSISTYVTGNRTLLSSVKQLQAGEYLKVDVVDEKMFIQANRYFVHLSNKVDTYIDERRLEYEIEASFERLCKWANGRQLVIPLSGGHDSRLIILMLKRLGYKDIAAFSYGMPGNREARISRDVAERVGVPWFFVPYSHKRWRYWFNSSEGMAYMDYAHGLSSTPHIQDWPAVWELKKCGRLARDCAFVPGHTVTLSLKDVPTNGNINTVTNALLRKHYGLVGNKSAIIRQNIERLVRESLDILIFKHGVDLADAMECWEWQERHSKFIINSVRVYDYFGFEWWIPLWDGKLMDTWASVPRDQRRDKAIYRKYVDELYMKMTGVTASHAQRTDKTGPKARILATIRRCLSPVNPQLYLLIRKYLLYDTDPLRWHGIVPRTYYLRRVRQIEGINSLVAEKVLSRILSKELKHTQ